MIKWEISIEVEITTNTTAKREFYIVAQECDYRKHLDILADVLEGTSSTVKTITITRGGKVL